MMADRATRQALMVAAVAGALCLALIFLVMTAGGGDRMAYDEATFHLPTILHFARGGSIADYPSATTPGYHLVMAAFLKAFGGSVLVLRCIGALFTCVFIFALARIWSQDEQPGAAWLALPAALSLYVIPAGVFLLPDNLAWLSVLGVMWLALVPCRTWQHVLLTSLLCALAILVRQSNAWVLAPAMVALWGSRRVWSSGRMLLSGLVLLAPAVLVGTVFFVRWGGLVPPSFQTVHQGISAVAPAWFLVIFGINAVFFLPAMRHFLSPANRRHAAAVLAAGAIIGCLLAVLVPNTQDYAAGRWSGLWAAAHALPVIHGQSTFVVLGAGLGGALLALWLSAADAAQRVILLTAIVGFCLAQAANHYVFDKYYLGFCFMVMALSGRLSAHRLVLDGWSVLGLLSLCAINLVVLMVKIS